MGLTHKVWATKAMDLFFSKNFIEPFTTRSLRVPIGLVPLDDASEHL